MASTAEEKKPKVLYVHGGNGRSQDDLTQSPIALYLAKEFETLTPKMDTSNYQACLQQQRQAIKDFKPNVLVGHTFGGALICELLRNKGWQGATVLLAPALIAGIDDFSLPKNIPIEICHGKQDEQISEELIRKNPESSITRTAYPNDPPSLPSLILPHPPPEEEEGGGVVVVLHLNQLVQRTYSVMPTPIPPVTSSSSSSSSSPTSTSTSAEQRKKKGCSIS